MTNVTSEVDKTPLALADAAEGSPEILEVHVDLAGDLAQEGDQSGWQHTQMMVGFCPAFSGGRCRCTLAKKKEDRRGGIAYSSSWKGGFQPLLLFGGISTLLAIKGGFLPN